jgi:hypothetical protein
MAVGTALAIATIASAAASTGGTIYASKKASSANDKALKAQTTANDQALAVEREERDYDRQIDQERYARDQARIDRLEARDHERWTTDANFDRTKYNANAPYRATGKAALSQLAGLAGLNVGDVEAEKVAMLPNTPPQSAPASAPLAAPATNGMLPTGRRPVHSLVPPAPGGDLPAPGEDGLVEMRMSPEAYARLSSQWSPRPRRSVRDLVPMGGNL